MNDVHVGRVYRHKNGGLYTVLMIGTNSTNSAAGELMVIYRSHTLEKINVRTLKEFIEVVEWTDGISRPRFTLNETFKRFGSR